MPGDIPMMMKQVDYLWGVIVILVLAIIAMAVVMYVKGRQRVAIARGAEPVPEIRAPPPTSDAEVETEGFESNLGHRYQRVFVTNGGQRYHSKLDCQGFKGPLRRHEIRELTVCAYCQDGFRVQGEGNPSRARTNSDEEHPTEEAASSSSAAGTADAGDVAAKDSVRLHRLQRVLPSGWGSCTRQGFLPSGFQHCQSGRLSHRS